MPKQTITRRALLKSALATPLVAGLLGCRTADTDSSGIGKRDCVRSMADGLRSGAVSAVEPAL